MERLSVKEISFLELWTEEEKKTRNLERFFSHSLVELGFAQEAWLAVTDGINMSLTVSDSPLK